MYLVEKGIFSGYEDGSFRPKDGVTRAQMAKVICVMLGGEPSEELKNLELGNMTPIDALNTLYRMQTKLKNRWSGNEK